MAKDKEKSVNPAAAARKAEKAKALKKGKAVVAQQRNDRLAKQNPHRIQSQIDDLKALEANHSINAREKKQLDELERELARVVKAKEAAGEKYVPRTHQQADDSKGGGVLGKRARGDNHANNGRRDRRRFSPESSATDEDLGDILMPNDTPPPLPRRRREDGPKYDGERQSHALPDRPEAVAVVAPAPSQAVYESKPILRDLRKEAAAFVPAAVRKRQADGAGETSIPKAMAAVKQEERQPETVPSEEPERQGEALDDLERLQEEEQRWRREMKQVTIEDDDEDGDA